MRSLLIAVSLLGLSWPALPQTMTTGNVSMVRTGWNRDSFAVVTTEPIINPAHCSTPDGYISDMSLPGYRTYYAAALTAMTVNTPVVIAVDNSECFSDRPKLIGINVQKK